MSNRALTWARKLSVGSAARKAVLMVLADRVDDETCSTIIGQIRIAQEADVGERTVRAVLAHFETLGILTREERRRPDGYKTSDRITLHVGWAPDEDSSPATSSPEMISPEPVAASGDQDVHGPGSHRQEFPRKSMQTSPANGRGSHRHQLPRDVPQYEASVEASDTRAAARRGQLELVSGNGSAPPARVSVLPTAQPPPRAPTGDYPSDFEAWWNLYPRKRAKADAFHAWKRARGVATWEDLIGGLRRSVEAWEREKTPPDKIPYPATWLNGRRWEDEPDIPLARRSEPAGFDTLRDVLADRAARRTS